MERIQAQVKSGKRSRAGNGFSVGELEKAGISIRDARQQGIRVDIRRKTVHDGNIATLKNRS